MGFFTRRLSIRFLVVENLGEPGDESGEYRGNPVEERRPSLTPPSLSSVKI